MNQITQLPEGKLYELPLSRDYVSHWGLHEAVREFIQNAIDSDSPFEFAFEGDQLTISSRLTELSARTLLLGASSKANQTDKIGSFGEGYKIALLVLARLGLPVSVLNGGVRWVPQFLYSETYDSDVLVITETPLEPAAQGLHFIIGGLGYDAQARIRENCLQMQPPIDDAITTPYGRILPSRPGKLYVSGLYVCDTPLTYGYDALPQYLALERDRQTVSTFDLQWLTKDMWFATQQWDKIAELMEADIQDLKYAEHGCPELVKEACYRQFLRNNPGGIAVKDQAEMERAVAKGMTKTVFVQGNGYYSAITSSKDYAATVGKAMRAPTPQDLLAQWLERHQRQMRLPVRLAFQALLASAAAWRVK